MPIIGSNAGSTKGPAGAPTIGTATAGDASASVTFTAPSFSKLPITSYTVTSSPGGITGTGASSPITVSGLSNATAYTFTVTATHANGASAASAASNSATPAQVYALGSTGPGGGKVFYDAGSTLSWGRYMEAPAGSTWFSAGGDPSPGFGGGGNTVQVGTSTAIGTAASNTTAMMVYDNIGEQKCAYRARSYTGGGVQWQVPSRDDLLAFQAQRGYFTNLNVNTHYTSSSENPSFLPWQCIYGYRLVDDDLSGTLYKTSGLRLRPIHYF